MSKRIYNANGGQRRSSKAKPFRVKASDDLISSLRNHIWRERAIKEFGDFTVKRLEQEFPDRVWDSQAIEWLKQLLKEDGK